MPTKKKRYTCKKCKRRLIEDKIIIIKKQSEKFKQGDYICIDCKKKK